MENITAYTGEAHVTSNQFRAIIGSLTGVGSYIANMDEKLEPELGANNTLKIHSGVLIHHGNVIRVTPKTYDTVTYINGTNNMKRIDLVVARYTKDSGTQKETAEWAVIQGTPAASDPVEPEYTIGNMQDGDLVDECPVFELHFDGLNVTKVEKVLKTFYPISEIAAVAYPLGAIYMSTIDTDPGELFGGVWEPWGTGRVPVGVDASQADFNTVEKTGGQKTADLQHSHTVNDHKHISPFGYDDNCYFSARQYGSVVVGANPGYYLNGGNGGRTGQVRLNYTSSSSPGTDSKLSKQSLLQPYITCYMWKRIA